MGVTRGRGAASEPSHLKVSDVLAHGRLLWWEDAGDGGQHAGDGGQQRCGQDDEQQPLCWNVEPQPATHTSSGLQ